MATAKPIAEAPAAKSTRRKTRKKPGPKPGAKAAAAAAANGDAAAPAAPGAAKSAFKHGLRDSITITASGEKGQIRARAEWATGNVSYYVAYTSTTGEYREAWIDQDLLTPFIERRKRAVKAAAAQ